jgi:Bifunctional DNA primase/polymerase, N-terminal/AAA domain
MLVMQTSPLTLQRLQLAAAGFSPIPVEGKRPLMTGWQTKFETSEGEIELWAKLYPYSENTGILTRHTPAIDIDILDPEAAGAIEQLIRERFEEHGRILVRFGNAPKRAILLRTNAPFDKLCRVLTAPNGSEHKIEVLANGQQVVATGIHPDTRRPYGWFGGEPGEVKRAELPEVTEQDMRQLLDDAAEFLVKEFGYTDKGGSRSKPNGARQEDGARDDRHPADWGILFARVLAGENLHDTVRDLAASFVTSGMTDKAAIARLQSLMTASTAEKGARWRDRYAEIPRAVRTAREKLEHGGEEQIKPETCTLHWHGETDPRESRPWLVQDLIPEIGSGLVSGQWGTYKSFTVLDMTGAPFITFEIVRRGGVLLVAPEGAGEIAVRLQGVIDHKGSVRRSHGPRPARHCSTRTRPAPCSNWPSKPPPVSKRTSICRSP